MSSISKNFKVNLMNGRECEVNPGYDYIGKTPITQVWIEDCDVDCYINRIGKRRLVLVHESYGNYSIHCYFTSEALWDEDTGYHMITSEELAILLYMEADEDIPIEICENICSDLDIDPKMYAKQISDFIYTIADRHGDCEYDSLDDLYKTALAYFINK